MSLEQLIQNCKKQDAKAQSQLYKLFSSKLFTVCLKYSRNHAEAQDTLHDAFITIFSKVEQYKSKGSFAFFLLVETRNRIASSLSLQFVSYFDGENDLIASRTHECNEQRLWTCKHGRTFSPFELKIDDSLVYSMFDI